MSTNREVFPYGDDLPTQNVIVGADDYFSIYLDSVCVSQGEDFWTKNDIGLTADLTVGNSQPVSLPVYSDRAANTDALLALSHFALMTYVPCNGQALEVGASMLRFDTDDFIKKALQAVSLTQSSTELTTYAAAAVPFVTLAASVGNEIYNAFGPKGGEVLIKTEGTSLSVNDTNPRYVLRDCYLLQYFGPDNMDDSSLYVHAGDVYWKQNNTPLRSGPWFLFRIERFEQRPDQQSKPWFILFSRDCLGEFDKLSPDSAKAQKAYSDALVLLENDPDFTGKDKRAISQSWREQLQNKGASFPQPVTPSPSPKSAFLRMNLNLPRPRRTPEEVLSLLGFEKNRFSKGATAGGD